MINMDIQELFDGSLSDEHTAELLHSLSVSPEKRADFRRHMALQGAIQADRADNRLTSDEDAAIWGAIAGLGTAAGAETSSMGWVLKSAIFFVMGVVGYLLGSNEYTNIFSNGSPRQADATARTTVQTALPQVAVVPVPIAAKDATATGTPAASGSPAVAAPAVRSNTSGSIHTDALIASAASSSRRSPRGTEHGTPRASSTNTNDINGLRPNGTLDGGNGSIANGPVANDSQGTHAADHSSAPVNLGDSAGNHASNGAVAPHDPLKDTAAKTTKTNAIAEGVIHPLSPEQVAKALDKDQPESPVAVVETRALALRSNGFEAAYGERLGVLAKNPQSVQSDPTFSNRHIDLSYRFADGMFGFGARVGYGSFSLISLEPDIRTKTDKNGNINLLDTVYLSKLEAKKMPLVEFFLNYRLPIGDHFAVSLEALVGGSTNHKEAGGSLFALWMLTDRFGIQAGGGFSRYWYGLNPADRDQLLLNTGDGASIDDNYTESVQGGMFEGKYGIFYHF